jgi:DivIVA domain-containing protein
MPLTPEDVQNKRFTVVRFKTGYDEEEVDNFLDEVEEAIRTLLNENKSLKQVASRVAEVPPVAVPPAAPEPVAAPEPPPPPPLPPMPEPVLEDNGDPALRTLMIAQRTAEEAINKAHADAQSIVNEARAKATALEKDLRVAHASRLAALEQERTGLIQEIAALRGFEREFRARLKSYFESSLSDLEARPSVEPAPPQAAPQVPAGAMPTTGRHAASVPTSELAAAAAAAAAAAPARVRRQEAPAAAPPAAAPAAPAPSTPAPATPATPAVAPPAPAPSPFSAPPPSGPPAQA